MRVQGYQSILSHQKEKSVSFKRAFTTQERELAEKLQADAKKLLDIDKVMIITPEPSLPAGKYDIGAGHLNSETSMDFYKFMKSYAGINNVKILPHGELSSRRGFYCCYAGSGFSLGMQTINLEELTKDYMGNILSEKTLKKAVAEKSLTDTVNYENVTGSQSTQYKALKEAFENFKTSNNPNVLKLKKEFAIYKEQNAEIIEKKALYEVLARKNKDVRFENWVKRTEKELFNPDVVPLKKREEIISKLKTENADSIEFTYFRQFLADKNIEKARKELNAKNLKLFGDCLIGFSKDEIWANPKAFQKDVFVASEHWGLRAFDFSKITDENSEGFKVLKQKVAQCAKRYDGIRFDVGWVYSDPIVYTKNPNLLNDKYYYDKEINAYRLKNKLDGKLLDKIEQVVKDVKGADFDAKNLIYEIEAGEKDFTPFDWNKFEVKNDFKNRTIVQSTCYMSEDYATVDMLENKMKVQRDNYMYMTGNHDHISLNALSQGKDNDRMLERNGNYIKQMLQKQYKALAKELKIDENVIKSSPAEFVKAKFAQLFLAKNIKIFFLDIFGSDKQYDSQAGNSSKSYRARIPANYEEEFHKAVQNNRGFNIFDALSKAMKAKGLDEKNKSVYDELVKFAKILNEKGALTEDEANGVVKKSVNVSKNSSPKIKLALFGAVGAVALGAALILHNKKQSAKHVNFQ